MPVMSNQTKSEAPVRDAKAGIYAYDGEPSANFAFAFARDEDNGTASVKNLPVFRVGSFADSSGYHETWTQSDLDQMVSNFSALSASFPNVPVRKDHTRSVDQVVGYVEALRLDGDMLLADYKFTEPEAADRWERGTFRSRSAEIGSFTTNDGERHSPVFMGFAFVDIPAVEGLFSKSDQQENVRFFTEAQMTKKIEEPVVVPDAVTPEPKAEFTKPLEMAKFTIGGVEVSDPAAVQAHITKMETFAREQESSARKSFAAQLVADKKILAPQEEALAAHAAGLSSEQFDTLKAVFSAAVVIPILEEHGAGTITNPDGESTTNALDQAIADAEDTVRMHERSGMSKDQVEATASFTKLVALRAERNK